MCTGNGSLSNSSRSMTSAPVRLPYSILYDITRVIPAPRTAACTAASEVLTVSLDRMGAAISTASFENFQLRGTPVSSTPMQS